MNAARLKPLPRREVLVAAVVTATLPIDHKSFAVKTAPTGLAVASRFAEEAFVASYLMTCGRGLGRDALRLAHPPMETRP